MDKLLIFVKIQKREDMKKKSILYTWSEAPSFAPIFITEKKKKTTGLWGCLHIVVHSQKKKPPKSEKPPFLVHRRIEEKLILWWILFCFSEIAEEFFFWVSLPSVMPTCLPRAPCFMRKLLLFWVFVCLGKMRVWSALFCLHCRDIIVE